MTEAAPYTFDNERTLDSMAYSSNIDLQFGQVTLFAVVCVGTEAEPHFSHGGQLTLDARSAIETALSQNQEAFDQGATCRYLPMAVGIDPRALLHMAHLVSGFAPEEPGDVG